MIGNLTAKNNSSCTDSVVPARLSIIVPVLNEQASLPTLIPHLQQWQRAGCEIILVDGGSRDQTVLLLKAHDFTVLSSPKGRAKQMNAGARLASSEVLLFLHADTLLPNDALSQVLATDALWGRFDVVIFGKNRLFGLIARLMNLRSRLTGIATGDQAIFMRKSVYEAVGGFPEQPLMEDVEISKRLLQYGKPACLTSKVLTSGRRWLDRGLWPTIWLMWRLRWRYWRGVSPELLAREYR